MNKGLYWNAFYQNPEMPSAVAKLLEERGFNPDGTRISTRDRLNALDQRISSDWRDMGFFPPQTVADPRAQYVGNNTDIFLGANSPMANTGPDTFGQDTRLKLSELNARIDADMAAMDAPEMPSEAPQNPVGGMSYTPPLPAPPPLPPPPKPTPRPPQDTYTVQKGDNPTTIARKLGLSLKELERRNPGILKKARRLKVGSKLKV